MDKILVTGGAGFIGSHLTNSLIRSGYRVMVVDNLSKGIRESINKKALFEKIDIRDLGRLNNVFKKFGPDHVFHLAAISSLSPGDVQEIEDVNVSGTENVLEASIKAKAKKVIFSSSAAVYGNALRFPTDENQMLNPISEYGISKAKAESKIISLSKRLGLNYAILRFSNVYGPEQRYDNEGGVVSIFCSRVIASKPVEIYGTGEQKRDFIYVEDIIRASLLIVQKNPINFIANISTANETKINELLALIEKMSYKKVDIILKSLRGGEINRSSLDNSFIKKLIGWKPNILLPMGVQKTYKYFLRSI
jgi:UDP-glucose 4-epimerase